GTQVLNLRAGDRVIAEIDMSGMAATVVRELRNNERIRALALESVETGEIVWSAERDVNGDLVSPDLTSELDALAASGVGQVRVRVKATATQKVLVRVDDVPGFGWRTCS